MSELLGIGQERLKMDRGSRFSGGKIKGLLVFVLLVSLWISTAFQAAAQSALDLSPKQVWERFQETCTQVLSDPDTYLSGLKRPGKAGERVISVSPDQKAVSVYRPTPHIWGFFS